VNDGNWLFSVLFFLREMVTVEDVEELNGKLLSERAKLREVCFYSSFFFTTQYPFLLHHDNPNLQQSWELCVCVCVRVFVCVGEFVAGLFFAGGVEGVEQLFGCCGWCKLVSFA
jgi:hypothetical protein